jgi:hypothetical protein
MKHTSSQDLITHKEPRQIIKLMERVHDGSKRISLRDIPMCAFLVDLRVKRVEI